MNKDLEKIKKMTADLTEEYKPGTIGQQAGGIIIACAERMVDEIGVLRFCIKTNGELAEEMNAEIARLKAEAKDAEESANQLVEELNKYRIENTFLKAELEKRICDKACKSCPSYDFCGRHTGGK